MYVPLRVHGWHSLLTGVDAPAALLARAAELGLSALALTDTDALAGSVDLLRAADGSLPRPLLGSEVSDAGDRPGRVVALVESERGYANLCKLVSARALGDDPGDPGARLDEPGDPEGPEGSGGFDLVEAVERFQEGLLLLVDHPRLIYALAERVEPGRLAVAVSPAALRRTRRGGARRRVVEDGAARVLVPAGTGRKTPPPARPASAVDLVESARVFGLATLAVPDVYYATPAGAAHHRARTAIKYNALRCDLPSDWTAAEPAYLMEPERLAALFRDVPDVAGPLARSRRGRAPGALLRTLEVAERCRFAPPLDRVLFPDVELEPGETAYSRLCALAFAGASRRFTPLRPEVVRRLDYELSSIERLGYAPYFLLVRRIADFAEREGIPHVGRGSAADSLVAYCLGLTDADPLRYRLPFERFLNPARRDRPDIDLDFCWRRRDEVLGHVEAAFGRERTAMISTLNRFGLRAAFRAAALAEGLPPVEVNRWSRRLPGFPGAMAASGEVEGDAEFEPESETPAARAGLSPGRVGAGDGSGVGAGDGSGVGAGDGSGVGQNPNPLARALAATPECRDFPFDAPPYPFVLEVAAALLDAPRHYGLHPGGVVVSPGPITDFVSCQRATKGVIVTQLDKDGVEAIGLVKMDLLGNRALTVIDDCRRLLAERGVEVDPAAVSEDDPRTAEVLARGRTLGCFQIESPGMRNLLQQTAARSMDDVIQAVALIRPGPAASGMKDAYVRRFRGLEEPHAPHPRLSELLWDTHGVMLYQEDVMQVVSLLAGMDLAEADELRRALAKRRGAELERLRGRYEEGCRAQGVDAASAARVWELVSNFASFGFCKAHAVTYGRIAYRAAYLKTHHPAAYLTAFLNSDTGYYPTRVYVEEARRLGIAILPPDVNRSGIEFTLEEGDDGAPGLRVGLARVRGLTEATRRAILRERERGAFLSLPDFLARTRARVDEAERLIQCGAFDAFDRTRPEMLWRLHLLTAPARRPPAAAPGQAGLDRAQLDACRAGPDERARASARAAREASQGWSRGSLGLGRLELGPLESAPLFPEPPTPALALPALPDPDAATRGRLELELLGLGITAHPCELFPCAVETPGRPPATVPCGELARHRGRRVSVRGWVAISRRVHGADGRWMRFVTLEDESGLAEAVLFADVYRRDGHRLVHRGPFLVSGVVEDQLGACTLHAERIW